MRRTLLLLFAVLTLAACGPVQFPETTLVPLGDEEPQRTVERFRETMPESFHLLSTIVFEYNWRKFLAVGYVDVSRKEQVFKAACMNPMGVKLLELSGDRGRITSTYAIAAFSRFGDVARAVGNDIQRIYFDLLPAKDARAWKYGNRVRFRQPDGAGTVEYVFGGAARDLIEKNYYNETGLAWRVSYYEYRDQDGKRFPAGIVYLNYQYGYRLTARQRELGF